MGYQEFRFYGKILTYLGFHNHSSVLIIFLPVSIQDMSNSCFHTDKEDPSSLLLTHSISGGMWNKSCTPCLKSKGLSGLEQLGWGQGIQEKHHPPWTQGTDKAGPKVLTHLALHLCKENSSAPSTAQSSAYSSLTNQKQIQKAIAGDLWGLYKTISPFQTPRLKSSQMPCTHWAAVLMLYHGPRALSHEDLSYTQSLLTEHLRGM